MFALLTWLPRAPLQTGLNRLPYLLKGVARTLPFVVQQRCLLNVLHHVMRDLIDNDELDFLRERQVLIWISDADIRWSFGIKQQSLTISQSAQADTVIRGKLAAFILLASRRVDPDTLFFQRRLVIEGDTDLGLALKNVLDTLEPERLPGHLMAVLDWLATQYMYPVS